MELSSPTKNFTLFPLLPLELRLKIWSYMSPGPRNLSIQYNMSSQYSSSRATPSFGGWTSPSPVPVILHICHESRSEALKYLQLSFGSYFHPAKLYFDFSCDTAVFGPQTSADTDDESGSTDTYLLDIILGGEYHGADDAEKIRSMVLEVTENSDLYGRRSFCWDEIRLFPVLQDLTILSRDNDDQATELLQLYRKTLRDVFRKHPEWKVPRITVRSSISGNEWGTLDPTTIIGNEL